MTVLYYNPNIEPEEEYLHRRAEQQRLLEALGGDTGWLSCGYDHEAFEAFAPGMAEEPEGGKRCLACFAMRMNETARQAKENGFEYFTTTLSVSPHKNYDKIKAAGDTFAYRYGVEFLAGNYKKKDGFKRSIELSKEYGLYRQDYCGCVFSLREAEAYRKARQEEG